MSALDIAVNLSHNPQAPKLYIDAQSELAQLRADLAAMTAKCTQVDKSLNAAYELINQKDKTIETTHANLATMTEKCDAMREIIVGAVTDGVSSADNKWWNKMCEIYFSNSATPAAHNGDATPTAKAYCTVHTFVTTDVCGCNGDATQGEVK